MKLDESIWKSGRYFGRISKIADYVAIKIEQGNRMNVSIISQFNSLRDIVESEAGERANAWEIRNACNDLASRIYRMAYGIVGCRRSYANLAAV